MHRIPAAVALLAAASLVLAPPASLAAQDAGEAGPRVFRVGVRAGVGVPLGFLAGTDASEGLATASFGFATLATIRPSRLPVAVRGELAYDRFGADLGPLGPQAEGLSGSWGILSGVVNLLAELPAAGGLRPYAVAGAGVYRAERKILEDGVRMPGGGAVTEPGVNGGGGVQLRVGRFDGFLEVRYHTLFADERLSYVPIAVGVEF